MNTSIQCGKCGGKFSAPEKLQGKTVSCPKCKSPIAVPSAPPTQHSPAPTCSAVAVKCSGCGAGFEAPSNLLGTQVPCPNCNAPIQIPLPQAPDLSPLGDLGAGVDLGASDDPLGVAALPAATETRMLPPKTETPQTKPTRRKKTRRVLEGDTLTIVAGALALVHGLGRGGLFFWFTNFRLLQPAVLFSLNGVWILLSLAIIVGFIVAGIGLLTKQPWAKDVGAGVAAIHFALLALGLFPLFIGLITSGNPLLVGGLILWMLPRMAAECVAPALLIYLHQREE